MLYWSSRRKKEKNRKYIQRNNRENLPSLKRKKKTQNQKAQWTP
jgi:hypothetical protein